MAAAAAENLGDGVLCAVYGPAMAGAPQQLRKLPVCLGWPHAHAGLPPFDCWVAELLYAVDCTATHVSLSCSAQQPRLSCPALPCPALSHMYVGTHYGALAWCFSVALCVLNEDLWIHTDRLLDLLR